MNARWYPRKLADKVIWHAVFNAQALEDGVQHGLSDDDVKQITADYQTISMLAQGDGVIEADLENWRRMRDAYTEAAEGTPKSPQPNFALGTPPPNAATGIGDRTERFSKKIKASDNYTEAVGAAYGIVAAKPPKIADNLLKPAPKATAIAGWKVKLKVALKGTSGVRVLLQRDSDVPHWIILGNFPDGEIIDETPPLIPNQPETRRYKMIFLRKNTEVGESSDIVEATTHA